jgi:hypothetical protein
VRGNTGRWLAEAFDGAFRPSGLPTNPPAAYFEWCAAPLDHGHRAGLAVRDTAIGMIGSRPESLGGSYASAMVTGPSCLLLQEAIGDARLTAETLGHRGLASVSGYTKITDARRREAYEEMQRRGL